MGAPACFLSPQTPGGAPVKFVTDYQPNPALAGKGPQAYGAVQNPSEFPWVWDRQPFHTGRRSVLYLDGSVRLVNEFDFQVMLANRKTGGKP